MVHCQDRNSSSLGCPANKNSPCADVPGKSCKPSLTCSLRSPHSDWGRHYLNAELTVRGQEACKCEVSLRNQAQETVDWGSYLQKRMTETYRREQT